MLKTVEGIYDQGKVKLQEKPDNIPPQTQVIVTFLTNNYHIYLFGHKVTGEGRE